MLVIYLHYSNGRQSKSTIKRQEGERKPPKQGAQCQVKSWDSTFSLNLKLNSTVSSYSKGIQPAAGDLGISLINHWWKPLSGVSFQALPNIVFQETATFAGYGEWNMTKWRYIFKNKVSEKLTYTNPTVSDWLYCRIFFNLQVFANLLTLHQGLFICFSFLFLQSWRLKQGLNMGHNYSTRNSRPSHF